MRARCCFDIVERFFFPSSSRGRGRCSRRHRHVEVAAISDEEGMSSVVCIMGDAVVNPRLDRPVRDQRVRREARRRTH